MPRGTPAARLSVSADKTVVVSGEKVRVHVAGLQAGERFTVRVGGEVVGSGTASPAGTGSAEIRLTQRQGTAVIKVTGASPNRSGTVDVRVTRG